MNKQKSLILSTAASLRAVVVAVVATSFSAVMVSAQDEEVPAQNAISSAFESITVSCKVMPDSKGDTLVWKYTNHWDFPLVIEHISAPCGCLDAITKPATEEELSGVAPGESGEIRAVVTPGNHRGLIRKSVYVRFFGHDDHVELIVEARIPSQVELSQQELTWTPAEKDESRVIDVTSGTGQDFNITDLLGVSEQLYTIRRELVTANHYRLHITPAGTLDPGIQILQIRTDSADPRCQLRTVFLRAAESTPSDESVTSGSGATPLKISDK